MTNLYTVQSNQSQSGKLSYRNQLKRLGITCFRCGSHRHGESDCTKLKELLNCSYCKERNRPSIGHVMETCYDKLGIRQPRTRSRSKSRNIQSLRRTSLSMIRKDNDTTPELTQPFSSDTPLQDKSDKEILCLMRECGDTIQKALDLQKQCGHEQMERMKKS